MRDPRLGLRRQGLIVVVIPGRAKREPGIHNPGIWVQHLNVNIGSMDSGLAPKGRVPE